MLNIQKRTESYGLNNQSLDPGDESYYSTSINLIDFEIKAMIGRGSFSKVYLVKKKNTGEYYAMKELKKSLMVNERKKGRVFTEK